MKSVSFFLAMAIGTLVSLRAERRAVAFYPGECWPAWAKDDFKESALVVIGRVTAVARFRTSPPATTGYPKEIKEFFYLATVTVGRTLKGKAKPDDDILFYTGSYMQRKEDNSTPTCPRVAYSHPGWTLVGQRHLA